MQTTRPLLFPLLLVVVGIITFKLAFDFILNGKDVKKQFHELRWEPREVLFTVIDSALRDKTAIPALVAQRQDVGLMSPNIKSTDSLFDLQKKVLIRTRDHVAAMSNSEVETFAVKSIRLDPAFSFRSLPEIGDNDSNYAYPLKVIYADSALPTKTVSHNIFLRVKNMDSDQFMLKYPNFGFWALLLVIQVILYVLLILFLLTKLFTPMNNFPLKWKVIYVGLIVLVCIAFYIWLLSSNDDTVIVKPVLFMRSMNSVFDVVNVLGYITAALCLAGMMFSSSAAASIGKSTDITAHRDELVNINTSFKTYFLIAALTMTLAVITSGQFYTALNTLDLVKAYNANIGHDYFRIELIYFYGILHTFILMIFFIPTQLRLNDINQKMLVAYPSDGAQLKVLEPVPMVKKVMDLLVMGAPLLAAFVKSLLDIVAG
ncbi:hypothetical protein CLV59_105490 [Chitinophaga dinghuensis]|uniref:Uncharacterized protein n=1 Tax=Chitinophaga dinghuensis TaxID=1539050 RepID=A0A327VWK0_9BACT|nr:hypothetical protein [Chitinophaga dinghuensis]RAJ80381.1 hypothetical protein CLV59_105490 [Chitinophaga dinghuensis]